MDSIQSLRRGDSRERLSASQSHYGFNSMKELKPYFNYFLRVSIPLWIQFNLVEKYDGNGRLIEVSIPLWIQFNQARKMFKNLSDYESQSHYGFNSIRG